MRQELTQLKQFSVPSWSPGPPRPARTRGAPWHTQRRWPRRSVAIDRFCENRRSRRSLGSQDRESGSSGRPLPSQSRCNPSRRQQNPIACSGVFNKSVAGCGGPVFSRITLNLVSRVTARQSGPGTCSHKALKRRSLSMPW